MDGVKEKVSGLSIISTVLAAVFGWWGINGIIQFFINPSYRRNEFFLVLSLILIATSFYGAYLAVQLRHRNDRARRIITAVIVAFAIMQTGLLVVLAKQKHVLRNQLVELHRTKPQDVPASQLIAVEQFDADTKKATIRAWGKFIGMTGTLLIMVGLLNFGKYRAEFRGAIQRPYCGKSP